MADRVYVSLAEVLEMHRLLVEEFGGSQGLRDRGRLEAAIFRPQIGYYNDLFEEAAALMESLSKNHAFMDGNKRIGFAATDTFLRVNGYHLEVAPGAANDFIRGGLGEGKFNFHTTLAWIRQNVKAGS